MDLENVLNDEYSKKHDKYIRYGTAGFRTDADVLDHVLYRMGILAVLRSKVKKGAIGLMITASHNVGTDNGVKLVDPKGEMLEESWERIATTLANTEDDKLISTIRTIIQDQGIDMSVNATVITGKDTRESSPRLLKAAHAGIEALGGTFTNFDLVTTPQLHYLVVCTNDNGSYGDPTLDGYYAKLSEAFKFIRGDRVNNEHYTARVFFDAANGVGGIAMKEFQKHLGSALTVEIHNDGNGELNHMCGADYVKVQQAPPKDFPLVPGARCVSVDGDADRVIYFYSDEHNKFHLLDGDRIATLIAGYFKELLQQSSLDLRLGLVQTAYANGGSTNYISNVLKVPVVCVPTGVKHLHHAAMEFDIGVYFEANGHGTVIFKDSATRIIKNASKDLTLSEGQRAAALKLTNVLDVVNQTVGDAISDMLLVETILHEKGWDVTDWEQSYKDLPNMQIKLKVSDRSIIKTTDAERRCESPAGLQDEIDRIVSQYPKARAFIRPSGTEDVVRLYAECEDQNDLNNLIMNIISEVNKFTGSIRGDHA